MSRQNLSQFGNSLPAGFAADRTALIKSAFIRKIDRGDYLTLYYRTILLFVNFRNRDRGQQCFCIRMKRILKQFLDRSLFNNASQLHDCNFIRNMIHY